MPLVRVLDAASGAPVEVDDIEASRGLAEGRYRVGATAPVRLRLADGGVADVAPERVAEALARPDTFVGLDTPEHEAQRARAREYGDRPIAAGVAAVARGASAHLSDVAGSALGFDETLAGLQEFNPEASIGGEIAGAVAPLLLSGGTAAPAEAGLLLRGARALTAPVRSLARLSEGAGGLVARGLAGPGAGLARRVLARGAGTAVEGLLEGAAGEAGRMLSEQALGTGDPALTAESVIARLGTGALFGAGAGGLLGGGLGLGGEALRGVGRLGREGLDVITRSWAQRTGTDLEPGVAEMLSSAYGRAAGVVSGVDPDAASLFAALTPAGRAARQIVDEGEAATFDVGARRFGTAFDAVQRNLRTVLDQATGARKLDDIRRVVRTDNFDDQLSAAQGMLDNVRRTAGAFQEDAARYGSGGEYGQGALAASRQMQAAADLAERRVLEAMDLADPAARSAQVAAALDDLKRHIGTRARRYVRERRAREIVDQLYERDLRAPLEDVGLWGEGFRGLQAETNAGWHRFLNWDGDVERLFGREGEALGFDRVTAADSARVVAYLRQLGTAANDSREQVLSSWIDGVESLLGSVGRHYELDDAGRRGLEELRASLAQLRSVHGDVSRRARILNQWQALSGGQSGGGLAAALGGAGVGAAALGGAALGAPLAIGGAALGALGNPARAARLLTAVERISRQADGQIGESVRRFLAGSRAVAREAGRRVRRGAVFSTAAYEERVRELDEQQRDLPGTTRRVADATRELTRDAPQVQQAMHTTAGRAIAYLQQQRPRPPAALGQLVQREAQPSRDEMSRFMRIARAVDDPLSVLADLESRHLTPEAVDAMRAVYPALYQRIVRQAMEALADADREPTYQDRLQLGILLGIPTDPSLVPSVLATLQAATPTAAPAPTQTSPAPTQRAPDTAGALASGTQRLEARRL